MGKGIRSKRKNRQHKEEVRKRKARLDSLKNNNSKLDNEILNELNELNIDTSEGENLISNNTIKSPNKKVSFSDTTSVEVLTPSGSENKKLTSIEDVATNLVKKIYDKDINDDQMMKMLKNMNSDPKFLNMLNMLHK
jgi:hypothetical protein